MQRKGGCCLHLTVEGICCEDSQHPTAGDAVASWIHQLQSIFKRLCSREHCLGMLSSLVPSFFFRDYAHQHSPPALCMQQLRVHLTVAGTPVMKATSLPLPLTRTPKIQSPL